MSAARHYEEARRKERDERQTLHAGGSVARGGGNPAIAQHRWIGRPRRVVRVPPQRIAPRVERPNRRPSKPSGA